MMSEINIVKRREKEKSLLFGIKTKTISNMTERMATTPSMADATMR